MTVVKWLLDRVIKLKVNNKILDSIEETLKNSRFSKVGFLLRMDKIKHIV